MSIIKLLDFIISAGAGLGFFWGFMLLTNKKMKSNPANRILAIVLITLSASILHSLLLAPSHQSLYKIREPFILLLGPLLSFYIYDLTGIRKHTWKDLVHGIPFLAYILFFLPVWTDLNSLYTEILHENILSISKVIWMLIVLQYGYYWWTIIIMLRRHRLAMESEFSNLNGKTLTWLHFFIHLFGAFLLLLVITLVVAFHTNYTELVDRIVCLGLSFAVFALGHNGLFQEQIFAASMISVITNEEPAVEISVQPVIARPDILSPAKSEELQQKLRQHLEISKPYVRETLTLSELASQIGATRNQLSYLINKAYNENFYSFINRYRVEEFKRLLAIPENRNFTILSIAYQAGFPSKSSFHTIFKKITGQTPSEYRAKLQ